MSFHCTYFNRSGLRRTRPSHEENVRPCNVYGLSKLSAELVIADHAATIFRTNFFGLSYAKDRISFTDWIIKSIKSKQRIVLFEDVFFSAIHMQTLCELINMAVIDKPLGVFNVGCSDGISKAEFALQLAKRLCLDTANLQWDLSNNWLSARRPLDVRLDTRRFRQAFDVKSLTIVTELQKAVDEYYG